MFLGMVYNCFIYGGHRKLKPFQNMLSGLKIQLAHQGKHSLKRFFAFLMYCSQIDKAMFHVSEADKKRYAPN